MSIACALSLADKVHWGIYNVLLQRNGLQEVKDQTILFLFKYLLLLALCLPQNRNNQFFLRFEEALASTRMIKALANAN